MYRQLGNLARARGDEDGFTFFEKALEIAREKGYPVRWRPRRWRTTPSCGGADGGQEEAQAYLERARELFKELGSPRRTWRGRPGARPSCSRTPERRAAAGKAANEPERRRSRRRAADSCRTWAGRRPCQLRLHSHLPPFNLLFALEQTHGPQARSGCPARHARRVHRSITAAEDDQTQRWRDRDQRRLTRAARRRGGPDLKQGPGLFAFRAETDAGGGSAGAPPAFRARLDPARTLPFPARYKPSSPHTRPAPRRVETTKRQALEPHAHLPRSPPSGAGPRGRAGAGGRRARGRAGGGGRVPATASSPRSSSTTAPCSTWGATSWTRASTGRTAPPTACTCAPASRVIRRELLFRVGDCYVPALLEDSERILRSLSFIADADVFGVRQPDGTQHVVVETRDEWSVRLEPQWDSDEGSLALTGVELREDNLLGTGPARKRVLQGVPGRARVRRRGGDAAAAGHAAGRGAQRGEDAGGRIRGAAAGVPLSRRERALGVPAGDRAPGAQLRDLCPRRGGGGRGAAALLRGGAPLVRRGDGDAAGAARKPYAVRPGAGGGVDGVPARLPVHRRRRRPARHAAGGARTSRSRW